MRKSEEKTKSKLTTVIAVTTAIFVLSIFVFVKAIPLLDIMYRETELKEQAESLQTSVNTKKDFILRSNLGLFDTQKIVNTIGFAAETAGITVTKFSSEAETTVGKLKCLPISVEVFGNSPDVISFFDNLCSSQYKIAVKGISFRPDKNYKWLIRDTDSNSFAPWYSQLPDENADYENAEISTEELMSKNTAVKFYMTMEFTGLTE